MNLQQLKSFKAIARTQSIAQAARELYTSPQVLSKTLKALEAELGVDLFERNGSHLSITDSGKTLLHYASIANNALDEAEAQINEIKQSRARTVRVIFRAPLGDYPRAFQAFMTNNPNITLHIATESEVHDDFDLEVLLKDETDSGDSYICEERWGLIVPAAHPFAKRSSVQLAELKGETFIGRTSDAESLRSICEDEGLPAPSYSTVCQQVWAMTEYVKEGHGVAFGPIVTWLNGNDGSLTALPIKEVDLSAKLVIQAKEGHPSPVAAKLAEHLRKHLYASAVNNCKKWTTSPLG